MDYLQDFLNFLNLNLSPSSLLILLCITFCAGIIDAIAGGGGILTVPALLFVGIPPISALATNKFQSSFGAFSSSYYFVKRDIVSLNQCFLTIAFTLVGAASGVGTVHLLDHLDTTILNLAIPAFLLVIGIALIFIKLPEDGEKTAKLTLQKFSAIFGLLIGFYDGFFGPGTGTFWTLAYVFIMGYGSIKAVGHTKVMNFTSNIVSLILFILAGNVIFTLGIIMAVVQFVGANIGARLTVKGGSKIIRPLIVIVAFAMVIKMLLDESTPLHKFVWGLLN